MNKLNYRKTFLLGFGFFAISVMWSSYNAFMPLILEKFLKSAAIIGFIMTIDNYLAIFIQPAVGLVSDNINTKIGKRMPFIVVGMPLASFLLILLANYKGFVMLLMLLVLTNLAMSIFRSPVISLMPDITHKENRSKSNSIINFMGGVGAVIAYFVGSKLWKINPKFPFYLSALLMIISFTVLFLFIKEKRDVIEYNEEKSGDKLFDKVKSVFSIRLIITILLSISAFILVYFGSVNLSLNYRLPFSALSALISFGLFYFLIGIDRERRKEALSTIKQVNVKNVLLLLFAICSWFIAYQGIEAFLSLYGVKFLGLEESSASMLFTFISISFLIFAIPAGVVGTKLGKKRTITIGVIGLGLSFFLIALVREIILIRILLAVAGLFWAMININSYPFVADMAPKGQVGKYTGFYYLFSSIAAIVSPPLMGSMIDIIGYKYMFIYGTLFMSLALLFILSVRTSPVNNAG